MRSIRWAWRIGRFPALILLNDSNWYKYEAPGAEPGASLFWCGAIADLKRFCEWLNAVPRKCVYLSAIRLTSVIHKLPPCPEETFYWLSNDWKVERKRADVIFYASGWGWRLRKHWRERLTQLEADAVPGLLMSLST